MQLHPYAMAIVNDLFDDELDADFLAEPATASEPAPSSAEPSIETAAPERRLQ